MECLDICSLTPIRDCPIVFLRYVFKLLRLKNKKPTVGCIPRHPSPAHATMCTRHNDGLIKARFVHNKRGTAQSFRLKSEYCAITLILIRSNYISYAYNKRAHTPGLPNRLFSYAAKTSQFKLSSCGICDTLYNVIIIEFIARRIAIGILINTQRMLSTRSFCAIIIVFTPTKFREHIRRARRSPKLSPVHDRSWTSSRFNKIVFGVWEESLERK
jgi:hypothetical protein